MSFGCFFELPTERKTSKSKLQTQKLQPVRRSTSLLNALAIGLWTAILLGVCIRIGLGSHSHDVFVTYSDAGRKWTESQALYSYSRGFVYSPLIAAFFALFSWMPFSLGAVLWRLLDVAVFTRLEFRGFKYCGLETTLGASQQP